MNRAEEKRLKGVEIACEEVRKDVKDIKDNHLPHLALAIEDLRRAFKDAKWWMMFAIMIIAILVTVFGLLG